MAGIYYRMQAMITYLNGGFGCVSKLLRTLQGCRSRRGCLGSILAWIAHVLDDVDHRLEGDLPENVTTKFI